MILRRSFDTDAFNALVNDPTIADFVRGPVSGELDLSAIVDDDRNVCLIGEHGGIIFSFVQDGIYDAHLAIRRGGRGSWAAKAMSEALRYVFTRTGAVEVLARCPAGNLPASTMARMMGGIPDTVCDQAWVKDGAPVRVTTYSLTIQDWFRTSPDLPSLGKQWISAAADEVGADDLGHVIPPNVFGATMEMLLHRQTAKAAVFYNRSAEMSSAHKMTVISSAPHAVAIGHIAISRTSNGLHIERIHS